MNPVYQIIADRSVRTAASLTAFQVVYRKIFRLAPPISVTVALNTVAATALCLDLTSTFCGTWKLGYPELCTRLPYSGNSVALTFDDGPHPDSTPTVLDILDQCKVSATFFLVGENALRYPHLVDEIVRRGHAVGLHGFVHKALANRSLGYCRREIQKTKKSLGTNYIPYFRPPYGFKSQALQQACVLEGVALTTWSIDSRDYTKSSPEQIADRVTRSLRPGAIILLHEWAKPTQAALQKIVSNIRSAGYSIVHMADTVSGHVESAKSVQSSYGNF